MADRFYTDQPLLTGEFTLDGPEAHHLATVRRFELGDAVTLFNGDGLDYPASILALNKKSVTLSIATGVAVDRELAHKITLAVAMPKGDRGEFLVEKLTELGVSRFVPLITERTVVSPKESRVEKLQRIVIEASKQCGRNKLMTVEQPVKWSEFLRREHPAARYVMHTTETTQSLQSAGECIIAVGPEGGYTAGEVQSAIESGWQAASLGKTILRVETAAIAAAISVRQ
ncbi:16S rRNA (uracil(1498)-N(3))-methyltransferase [soil metagenome]